MFPHRVKHLNRYVMADFPPLTLAGCLTRDRGMTFR